MTVTSDRAPIPTDTRERILDAGEEAVRRFGLRRVSMAEVAELARVSRGSVYRYFPDRNTLVAAVLRRTAQRFVESSAASVRRRRTLAAQVAEAAVFIREHMQDESLTLPALGDDDALFATLLAANVDGLVTEWVQFWQPLLSEAAAARRDPSRPRPSRSCGMDRQDHVVVRGDAIGCDRSR